MFIFKRNSQLFENIKAASRYVKNVKYGVKKILIQISIIEFFNKIQKNHSNIGNSLVQQF